MKITFQFQQLRFNKAVYLAEWISDNNKHEYNSYVPVRTTDIAKYLYIPVGSNDIARYILTEGQYLSVPLSSEEKFYITRVLAPGIRHVGGVMKLKEDCYENNS